MSMTNRDLPDVDVSGDDEAEYRVITDDVSCENCAHQDVCGIYYGIAPMFEQWAQRAGQPPFELVQLAAICRYYDPVGGDDDG